MGIIDRFGRLIKYYILDEDDYAGSSNSGFRYGDPDYEAASAELNEFLRGAQPGGGASPRSSRTGDWEDPRRRQNAFHETARPSSEPPAALRKDYAELGVPFGADEQTCKAAYKKLLKIHHPDRHAGAEANLRKATEKSARINTAYENITRWQASI